ncbi:hypothetical protein DKX38_013576 [Salix brachista]|uniref:Uncharacterized protein n=1 Tax=Salix brachista TaxID=2182728 RepID=A0A5N5LDJ1_9ROSI|nr:hypothetical protein DKX38_013576 [Salix brachista]
MGLPFPLWNKEGLSLAASMVGKPLACDEHTITCGRLEYARVCVEVEADALFVHHFKVESHLLTEPITIEVLYEWKPSRCSRCKVYGHACKEVKEQIAPQIEAITLNTAPENPTTTDKGKSPLVQETPANTKEIHTHPTTSTNNLNIDPKDVSIIKALPKRRDNDQAIQASALAP